MQMNWKEDPSLPIEPWQIEDYRHLPISILFGRLKTWKIALDETRFISYAESCSSPEELVEVLWVEEDDSHLDEAYLLVFELWRRLLPEKQSLSIFCDELDHLIDLYDNGALENEELLVEALTDLESVLDEHADQGEDSKQIFTEISLYCAHDLESFIYDYASAQLDQGNGVYASELVDGFFPYILDIKWFDFLHLRLIAETDIDEANIMLSRLLEILKDEPDFELLLEIARFLVHSGATTHFVQTVKQARKWIGTEQDFQELLAISCEFYRLLDREEETSAVAQILKERQGNPLEEAISPQDASLKAYYQLFENFERSEA